MNSEVGVPILPGKFQITIIRNLFLVFIVIDIETIN